ncbi:MAG: AmmeMemoRadiSam system protein B [Nitrospirae bacterium]|nr:AmmeMemoRadiSam system protein B [Nitrospirota bacterium]
MIRKPAVAGQFYPGTPEGLTGQVSQYIVEARREPVIGAVCPHAGLIYSGSVAGAVYSRIQTPETFVLLGPNHTGLGEKISLMHSGTWEIPTGSFHIDERLAHRIYMAAPELISKDARAHMFEHSLEVQLPFIAYFSTDVKIVPITFMQASLEECEAAGTAVAKAVRETGSRVTIIASSDMSHYVPEAEARYLDGLAIEHILSLDPEGLYRTVLSRGISMCGYLPVTAMLYAAVELGAFTAELIKYTTSAEVSGDYDQVVGYAGIVVK